MGWFCPDDFEPSEKSRTFAKQKGLTDEQITDQVESMRDWEFTKKRTDWDRVFRNWIRQGIDWGRITLMSQPRKYRQPEECTDEQRKADEAKAWAELNRLKAVK